MSNPILYSYFRSSSAFRVRIALELKKIPYEYRSIHLVKDGGEQHSLEYHALNPMNQVPLLVDEDFQISQSMAILQYLDKKWPQSPLFPNDLKTFATVVSICEMINSGIQPIQNLTVLQKIEKDYGADKKEWGHFWIHKGFQALEKTLSQSAGSYCVGGAITAADLFLVPQVYNALRFGVELNEFPIISRINNTCLALEAFEKSAPHCQPDTPANY